MEKLRVGIIGSGKIGTDLLIKTLRSYSLECALFIGRNSQSAGMKKARSLGVATSDESIGALDTNSKLDLIFDATSAEHHKNHAPVFQELGIKAIDLTPAKVGPFCVPSIDPHLINSETNINMVTCGGQASIPIIQILAETFSGISAVSVESYLAKDSVGPATLANIDEYYSSTAHAISQYSGIRSVSVDLSIEDSDWQPDMLTRIRAYTHQQNVSAVFSTLQYRLNLVRQYVPGYSIVGTPKYENGAIEILISVRGQGDWIPSHAGNLDIINCAALCIAERYAVLRGISSNNASGTHAGGKRLSALRGLFSRSNSNSSVA